MSERPYVIVSTDSHISPNMRTQLRKFCPPDLLSEYDAFVGEDLGKIEEPQNPPASEKFLRCRERMRNAPGVDDPKARLEVMDSEGIAAELMFAGSGNNERIPFIGFGLSASNVSNQHELDLVKVGCQIWNDGVAEFAAEDPERLMPVFQIAIWDLEFTIAEARRAKANGLHVMNLPAPRRDYPPYSNKHWEPLWDVCEELGITLVTHSGGGERPLGENEDCGYALVAMETHWLSRRNIWQMILGGVFERHPNLKIVFCEQRTNWITETLHDLDSAYAEDLEYHLLGGKASRETWFERPRLSKAPSEYFLSNCFVGASFLAPYEAARFHEFGMQNIMWGSDYPHMEGTWPVTQQALRNTFSGLPEDDVRKMLGETAMPVFHLDPARMQAIADRIGYKPGDLDRPLSPDEEIPENRSYAFRTSGSWA